MLCCVRLLRHKALFDRIQQKSMWMFTMPRPTIKDRSLVRKRTNVMLKEEVKLMAKRIGDGNMSKGIEKAVQAVAFGKCKEQG